MGKDKKKELEEDILENEETVGNKETKKERILLESEADALKEENEKLVKKISELKNENLLTLAEMQNYKKRVDSEMDRVYKYSTYNFCKDALSVLDNLDHAIDKKIENEELKAYLEGFKIVRNQYMNLLEKEGVKEMESPIGKKFDANIMEPIAQMEDPTKENEVVLAVAAKGYMYKDRVLRVHHVVVNKNENDVKPDAEKQDNE